MTRPPRDDHGFHALIEHYTPDGTLGRLVFGLFGGSVAGLLSWIGAVGLVSGQPLGFLVGVPLSLVGLALIVTAFAALWPVYLSLIGNLEAPETYAVGEGLETPEADPEAILQRRYAEGEIGRETFERRLDDVLATDADRPVDGRRDDTQTDDPDAPGERVTAADAPETDELRAARERARSRRAGDDQDAGEERNAADDHDAGEKRDRVESERPRES